MILKYLEKCTNYLDESANAMRSMERAAKRSAAKEDQPGLKEEPKYTESDKRADIEKEADLIKDLLKDEGLEKAELAFLVADALKTPGSIADKLDTARTKGMTIAAGKKKTDRDAMLLAYKGATEKELAKIKAVNLQVHKKLYKIMLN
jgi:hypothetical protein